MCRVKEKFYDCEYNNQVISKMKLPNIEAVYRAFEAAAQSYGCQKEDPEKVKARQKHHRSPFTNWK